MTLEEYLELWLRTYVAPKRAPKTAECYRFALRHIRAAVRELPLDQITALHLQGEINTLAARYSREAQLLFAALHAAMAKAVKLQLIPFSPMAMVEKPEHEKAEIAVLTEQEAAAYLAEAAREPAGNLLALMLCLGLRRNEARALRGIDLGADGVLRVRHQLTAAGFQPLKSRSSRRDIPVPEPLRSFFAGPPWEYLAQVSETGLRRQHLAVLARIGVRRRITLHGLRHTCATVAMGHGTQVSVIQHLLGHAHYQLTADTYIHPNLTNIESCTNVLFGALGYQISGVGARLEIV